MRIAHLAFDQKFIPFAQDVFEDAFPGENSWFLLHPRGAPLRYVSNLQNVQLVSRRELWSRTCVERIGSHEMVVVHAMIPEFAEVVRRLPAAPVVLWFGWGYEYYDYLDQAFGPVIPIVALFNPASSPACQSRVDTLNPRRSAQRTYIR